MHHFPLHIGDFSTDTAPFTAEEVGIYLRLLMLYYGAEGPLDNDHNELAFKTMARTRSEKEALNHVLRRCFTLDKEKNTYVQKRCEAVIAEYLAAGVQSRYACLCRHWEKVNSGHAKPAFADFAKNPDSYFEPDTGHVRKVTGRNSPAFRLESPTATDGPPPHSQPRTNNQEPITITPIVPKGHDAIGLPKPEAVAEAIYAIYPRKTARGAALKAIDRALKTSGITELEMQAKVREYAAAVSRWSEQDRAKFVPYPATWFNQQRYMDDPATWERVDSPASQPRFDPQKNKGGRPVPDITAEDLAMDLPRAGDEPTGWRAAWSEMFVAPVPDSWAGLPQNTQDRLIEALDAAEVLKLQEAATPKKKKGGAE